MSKVYLFSGFLIFLFQVSCKKDSSSNNSHRNLVKSIIYITHPNATTRDTRTETLLFTYDDQDNMISCYDTISGSVSRWAARYIYTYTPGNRITTGYEFSSIDHFMPNFPPGDIYSETHLVMSNSSSQVILDSVIRNTKYGKTTRYYSYQEDFISLMEGTLLDGKIYVFEKDTIKYADNNVLQTSAYFMDGLFPTPPAYKMAVKARYGYDAALNPLFNTSAAFFWYFRDGVPVSKNCPSAAEYTYADSTNNYKVAFRNILGSNGLLLSTIINEMHDTISYTYY